MSEPPGGSTWDAPDLADRDLADRLADAADRIRAGGAAETDPAGDDPGGGDADAVRRLIPALEAMGRLRQSAPPVGFEAGRTLGDFRTVRVIGRGGMGVVYEAVQVSLHRPVALKTLPGLGAEDPRLVRRFQIEAQAAAGLNHPHIVPVYAVGEDHGVHYYAMQLIRGRTLAAVIAGCRAGGDAGPPGSPKALPGRVSPGAAADLGRQAAEALHHAHLNGVIHRDVKPGNLLVEESGWLWVADFGLALVKDGHNSSAGDALRGTLRYMSPEHASGRATVGDPRTDVYSLGATLYELLTLRPVYEGEDRLDLLRRMAWEDPRPPRRVDSAIPADLETVVMKAIDRDPSQRYATAGEMADDLRRFLEHRPIKARPPGALGRAARWARRNRPTVAAAAVAAFAALTALAVASAWSHRMLARHNAALASALALAERKELLNRRYSGNSQVRMAQQELAAGHVEFVQEALERVRPAPGEPDDRGFEWHYLHRLAHRDVSLFFGHESPVNALAVSPDGRTLVSGDESGVLVFWDLVTRRERARTRAAGTVVHTVAFAPDGRTVAASHVKDGGPSVVRLWDAATAQAGATIVRPDGGVIGIAFSHDGRLLAVWEAPVGAARASNRLTFWRIDGGGAVAAPGPPPGQGHWFAASPDRRLFATVGRSGPVTLRDAATARPTRVLPGRYDLVSGVGFSPDGRRVLVSHGGGVTAVDTAGSVVRSLNPAAPGPAPSLTRDAQNLQGMPLRDDRRYWLADPASGPRPTYLEGAEGGHLTFLFSPDGSTLAGSGTTPTAILWETSSGKALRRFPPHTVRVASLAFSPGGESLFVASSDPKVRAWHLARGPELPDRLAGHRAEVWALAYTPDGSALATAADDHTIQLWDPRDGTPRGALAGHTSLVSSLAVSPDGRTLASGGFDRTVRLWDLPSGRPRAVLRGHTDRVRGVAFSPDGRTLASASSDDTLRLWDSAGGREPRVLRGHTDGLHALAFHPGGRYLVSAGNDATLRVWDLAGARGPLTLPGSHANKALAFSRDGSLLASGDAGGYVSVRDTGTWSRVGRMKGSDAEVFGLAFSGRSLAAGCGDAKVRLWDPFTGQLTLTLDGHPRRVNAVAFSPDGSTLASASHDGAVRLWRAGEGHVNPF